MVCVAGCTGGDPGPSAPVVSEAPVPAGFKRLGGPGNGVSVAVPASWATLDLTKDDIEQGLAQSGLSGSALDQAKQALKALVTSKAVWASDPASVERSPDKFATNLNGFCQRGTGATAAQLIADAKAQLATLDAEVSEAGEVRAGAGTAVRIVYTFTAGGVKVRGTQFYVPASGRTCIVTISTDREGQQALFDQIGGTVRAL